MVKASIETFAPRMVKNIQVLATQGYEIDILSWDRENKHSKTEHSDSYQAYRFKLKAPFGVKILFYLPIWWFYEFNWLMKHDWDIVHAFDFDTLPPAVLVAKLKRKKVIYEIADYYQYMIPLPSYVTRVSNFIDHFFMGLTDAIIIADEYKLGGLKGISDAKITVIYGSPPDVLKKYEDPQRKNKTFKVFYCGSLHKERRLNLDKVINAIREMNNVNLVIAGYGTLVSELKDLIKGAANIEFIGSIEYEEALRRTVNSDLLVAMHSAFTLSNNFNLSVKVYEALMAGKPILVSSGHNAADFVEKEKCGLAVDESSIKEIRNAIEKLRDNPDLCRQLGENGRKLYEQRYSWDIMEKRLISLYGRMSDRK